MIKRFRESIRKVPKFTPVHAYDNRPGHLYYIQTREASIVHAIGKHIDEGPFSFLHSDSKVEHRTIFGEDMLSNRLQIWWMGDGRDRPHGLGNAASLTGKRKLCSAEHFPLLPNRIFPGPYRALGCCLQFWALDLIVNLKVSFLLTRDGAKLIVQFVSPRRSVLSTWRTFILRTVVLV